jgi:two-component system cell cycle sensor histidine kinase/response regulator CckA
MSETLHTLLLAEHKRHIDLVLEHLKQGGFKPITKRINSYRSLIAALQHGPWDIIIIDDTSKYFSVQKIFTIAAQYKTESPPVFVIAERLNRKKMLSAIQAGARDYFPVADLSGLPAAARKELAGSHKKQREKSDGSSQIQSEDKYRQLFNSMPIGLYQSLPGGKIIDANNSLVQILGYPDKKTLLHTRAAKLYVNPDDRKKWQHQLEQEETLYANEVQFYRFDRSKIWVRETTRAFFDKRHRVIYYEGAIEDITRYKLTEKELRRRIREQIVLNAITANASEVEDEESLFKHTTAIIRDLLFPDSFGIMLVDETGGVLRLTHSFHTHPSDSKNLVIPLGKGVTGKVALTGIAKRVADTRVDPDYMKIRTEMRSEIAVPIRVHQKIIGVMDAESQQPDMFTESDERILTTLAHQLASTIERLRVVKELKNEHQFLSGVLRGSPAIICGILVDGRTRFINPIGEKITGYGEAELRKKDWWKIFYPGKEFAQVKKLFNELEKEDVKDYEMILTTRNNEKRIVSWSSMKHLDKNGKLFEIIFFGNDITDHQAAEEALIESEDRLRRIAEASFEGIGFTDGEKIIDANPQLAEMFGYSLTEIIGKNIIEFVAPDHRELVIQKIKSGYKKTYEHKAIKKDGTIFYVEVRGGQIIYQGKTVRVTAIRDVTERKRVENELYQSKQMLELILDNIPQRVFWKDRTFRYLGCNRPFARDANCESTLDIIGKDDFELSWKDTAALYRADDRLVMESNTPKLKYEEPQSKPDGEQLWLHTNKIPLHDQQGQVIGVLGTYEDITDRKRIEDALRKSENKFRQLFQNANDAIYLWKLNESDTIQELLEVNDLACDLLGYSREELLRLNPQQINIPESNIIMSETIEKIVHQGKCTFEMVHRHKNGNPIPVEINAHLFTLGEDRVILSVTRDIRERKKSEEEYKRLQLQLTQTQKLESIGTLAGGIAHDFNNLLTVINGHSEMALGKIGSQQQDNIVYSDLVSIHKACEKAIALTKQILAFSRKQIFEPQIIDINSAIDDLNIMLKRLIGENISIETDLKPGLPSVKADPAQLEQVLINLIINARDAINAQTNPEIERKITIHTDYEELDKNFTIKHPGSRIGPHILILVRDTGIGISDQIINKIFEPFFTTKEIGRGTGLGLATVYGIIKQNNGSIWVDSQPGKGSRFRVYWPTTYENNNVVKIEKDKSDGYTGKETILLVEDDAAVREFTNTALQNFGYRVFEASNGNQALKLIADDKLKIDLLITDLIMPEMNGKELAEKVSAFQPMISILFTSGYTEDYIVRSGELEAGIHFLQKPYSINILAQKVRTILDKYQPSIVGSRKI